MSPDELIAFLIGPAHLEVRDASGRPLGEAAADAYATTPRDEATRSFGDGRDATGLPCNLAALAQLRGHWDSILEWVGGIDRDAPSTMGRVARRAYAATRIAPLRAARGEVPSVQEAALFKAFLGFNELASTLLIEEKLDADEPPPPIDPWIDERPWLIGDVQVCAGTRSQIRRAWAALVEGDAPDRDVSVAEAVRELEALTAAAAGAARVAAHRGAMASPAGARLLRGPQVPRLVEALRGAPDAGPMHVTLLFESQRVPRSLRAFIESLAHDDDADDALLATAREPAARLLRSLGREGAITLDAFRDRGGRETAE